MNCRLGSIRDFIRNFDKNLVYMRTFFSTIFLFLCMLTMAQQKPQFWDDIQKFKQLDIEKPPMQNAILLIGSSSFTMWQDVGNYFPEKEIINRGFGGSSLKDLNIYADDLLKPYNPKQILIYCGENDFSADETLDPKVAFDRYKTFYATIRKYYPNIQVDYISIKMSPSRERLWKQFEQTNAMIKKFMKREKNASYIDITKVMLDKNGHVRKDIFLEDMLHMKPSGYVLWSKKMAPYLK